MSQNFMNFGPQTD